MFIHCFIAFLLPLSVIPSCFPYALFKSCGSYVYKSQWLIVCERCALWCSAIMLQHKTLIAFIVETNNNKKTNNQYANISACGWPEPTNYGHHRKPINTHMRRSANGTAVCNIECGRSFSAYVDILPEDYEKKERESMENRLWRFSRRFI